jgi:capsule polysaccharide export protein KpsE/RkpR
MDNVRSGRKTSFFDVLGLLNRRKWVIIVTTLAGTVGVFLFVLISILLPQDTTYLPNYYIPEAHVLINESASGGLSELVKSSGMGSLASLAGIGGASPTASGLAIRIATTDSFLDRVAQEFDFYNRYNLTHAQFPKSVARNMIHKSLQFKMDSASGMMTVGYQSTDKALATDIVNRIIGLLEEEFTSISIDRNRTQLALIDRRLADVEQELQRLQDQINSLHDRYNTFDIAQAAKEQASRLAALRAELLQKSMEVDAYSGAIGIEDPALRKLRTERDALRANISKLEKGYRESGILVPAENELPQLAVTYTRLKGDLDIQKKLYETLISQQELIKLQVESVPPTFQIYEKAAIPEVKTGPSRGKIGVAGAGASFFLGILLAFLVDYFRRMLKNPRNVETLKGIAARE